MNNISVVHQENGVYYLQAEIGSSIESVCADVVQLAKRVKSKVVIDFNGVEIAATHNDSTESLAGVYKKINDERNKIWQESEEKRKSDVEALEAIALVQCNVDKKIADLDVLLASSNEAQLIKWIGEFAEINGYSKLVFDKRKLASKFEKAGYSDNEGPGKGVDIRLSKEKVARYIVGQAINCLRCDLPLHSKLVEFARQYSDL